MPVIRPSRLWDSPTSRQTLVDRLADELEGRGARPGPVIFEIPIIVNDTLHVIVVWAAWAGIPPNERSSIILASYAKFDASRPGEDPVAPRITVAVGSTPEEALASDLLPFVVRPQFEPEGLGTARFRDEMIEVGAIEFPSGVELRFPTRQMAVDAQAHLRAIMPEAHWAVVETVGNVDDLAWRRGV